MLPKQHRLPGNRIPTLLKQGVRTQSEWATLIAVAAQSDDHPTRLAVIVPYRLSKKAVVRNRARRLIREAIHTHISELTTGFEAIVMAKKIVTTEKLQNLQPIITELLRKGNLLPHS